MATSLAGNVSADLVAHYTFDDGDGRNYGSAGSAADGALMNGASVVYDPVGQWNKDPNYVLLLNYGDGTVHQYMDCGKDWANWDPNPQPDDPYAGLEPLTIAAWIKVTSGTWGSWRTIMSKGHESSWDLSTGTYAGAGDDKIAFSAHRGLAAWSPLVGTVNVRDGQWHHIVGVVAEGEWGAFGEIESKLYIDAELQGTDVDWGPVELNNANVFVGADPIKLAFGCDYSWNGMIDDVRIYDEALSEYGIMDIYAGHSTADITLTVEVEPNDVGINTVTPGVGQHLRYQDEPVHLQAINFIGCPYVYQFVHWEGDVIDANSADTLVIMNEDKTVTAVFIDTRECGDECHPILQGDLNGDCHINLEDFAIYCAQWLACTAPECD